MQHEKYQSLQQEQNRIASSRNFLVRELRRELERLACSGLLLLFVFGSGVVAGVIWGPQVQSELNKNEPVSKLKP